MGKDPNEIRRILVDRLDVHGDVLVATSVLPGLARKYPNASIDWHVRRGFDFALKNNPHIHRVIMGPRAPGYKDGYDLVVTPDHHYCWNRPMAQIHCDQAGVPLHKPELYFSKEELDAVPERFRGRVLVTAYTAGWQSRTCPNLGKVLALLRENQHQMLQADNGRPIADRIDHFPELKLREIATIMHYAKLYIGIDTVFMHMAVACGVPMVLCMGPTDQRTQFIPNATVIKPFKHDNPAMGHKDFAHGIDIPLGIILTGIRTKLSSDGDIVDRVFKDDMISYVSEEEYDIM